MATRNVALSEDELVYILAAVGRVSYPLDINLMEYLKLQLPIGEHHVAEELAKKMEFS